MVITKQFGDWPGSTKARPYLDNSSYIALKIMTKLHVHYTIVTYTQIKIHETWPIAYLNRGYIDPTESRPTASDANRPTVRSSRVSRLQKILTDQFYFFRSADCLWDLANGLESTDRLSTIGRSSVDGRLTLRQLLFNKMSRSNQADCQPITGRLSAEWWQIIFIFDR